MFKVSDRDKPYIQEYRDLFWKESVVVGFAQKSTSQNRNTAVSYLKGSLELREQDGRKFGFDDGHWYMKEAIKVSQLRANA
eukprot:2694400-Rhodomonas_salina.1